jgi:hypothetical protein
LQLPRNLNSAGTGTRAGFVTTLATATLLAPDAVPVNPPAAFGAVVDTSPP